VLLSGARDEHRSGTINFEMVLKKSRNKAKITLQYTRRHSDGKSELFRPLLQDSLKLKRAVLSTFPHFISELE